ncbi:peptidoglycan-recognition protein LB-like [Epargyreus clarus]|uniref:peptidoglycan-recognition protein LB-like n=1 Tax=Epargyreus clarus TaxID=520877 RepID=UPI003C30A791
MCRNYSDCERNQKKKWKGFQSNYTWAAGFIIVLLVLITLCVCITVLTKRKTNPPDDIEFEVPSYNFSFLTRAQWNARPPIETTRLSTPVPYVVIHHSYQPPACNNTNQCILAMRSMQNYHMDVQRWWDIGYNFAIGGNEAYEGRGWNNLGAHALHFNSVSIGICLIGDWSFSLPTAEDLLIAQQLIDAGVALGYVSPDYKLIGHRQVRETECPGNALFKEIQNWAHYSPFPSTHEDLLQVKELSKSVKEVLRKKAMKVNETDSVQNAQDIQKH